MKEWLVRKSRALFGFHLLDAKISALNTEIAALRKSIEERPDPSERHYRDVLAVLLRSKPIATLQAAQPIAVASDDHKFPRGAKNDNTRHPRFVLACERIFKRPLTALDLGCAGGGLVLDFILKGHRAFGIEGSDFPLRNQLAEWRTIPNSLFTGDITKPFTLSIGSETAQCDVITAWEVMEHIAESDLPGLFSNVREHIKPGGLFVGSVAMYEDRDDATGAVWHKTVKPKEWWYAKFLSLGFRIRDNDFAFLDFCRGTGNGPQDINFFETGLGFHFVAEVK